MLMHAIELNRIEEDVRSRLEPIPSGGLKHTTLACLDARPGHPDCPVLGSDHKRHVVRIEGALHGACTNLNIAYATDDLAGYEATTDQTHEISKDVAHALRGGPRATVHEECVDMDTTPDTIAAMAIYNRDVLRLARRILCGNLDESEYARVVMGSSVIAHSRRVEPHTATVLGSHRRSGIPVARLRNTNAQREAFVVNHTGLLLPPMEFDSKGQPLNRLVYDADPSLVNPRLAAIGKDILSLKLKARTLDVVSAVHEAVLVLQKLHLPVIVLT